MTITVLDTCSAMRDILTAPVDERRDLLRSMLEPAAGMYRWFPGEVDLVEMHLRGSGFPIDRDERRCLDAVEALHAADAWSRIARALADAVALQRAAVPEVVVPDELVVLLIVGDPADQHFLTTSLGMTGNGSVPGYLYLNIWPFPENVARIEASAVHELNHNLRYGTRPDFWDPATVAVGEHVVSEGLADAFARQVYGDELGRARIGLGPVGDDEVFAKVVSGLGVTGMQHLTAWVHGDAHAQRYGGTPVGLPTGAGYAAGNRLVDAYLAATGRTAAEALLAPSREVIDVALA